MDLLKLSTDLTPTRVRFKQTPLEFKMVDEINQILAKYTLLFYPNFNEHFDINTD